LAEDQGAVVLALASPGDSLLVGDPIRLLAYFREQNEPMMLASGNEVSVATPENGKASSIK
jgi:hypothetical protein